MTTTPTIPHTLVMGLGASALAMVARLHATGHQVRLYSDQPPADQHVQDRLAADGVDTRYGTDQPVDDVLAGIEQVAPSPAFAPHHPILAAAEAAGIPVVSEPELAWRLHPGHTRLVGITGTNGKTTTTQLIGAGMAAAFGPVPLLGNIGVPLTQGLTADLDIGVVELSSFQLHYADQLTCEVAVLTNVADDHLSWHGTFEDYGASKAKIWAHTKTVIVPANDPAVAALLEAFPPAGEINTVDPEVFDLPIQLLGTHNRLNAALAHAACLAMGADREKVEAALIAQTPDAHRMQHLGQVNGVTFINDSKATNPHAAIAAIQDLERVHWILGGDNKGVAFDTLIPWMQARATTIYAVGTCHTEVVQTATAAGVPVVDNRYLQDAFAAITARVAPGDTVLLSPAAASTDQFPGYAQRGELFAQLVEGYANA